MLSHQKLINHAGGVIDFSNTQSTCLQYTVQQLCMTKVTVSCPAGISGPYCRLGCAKHHLSPSANKSTEDIFVRRKPEDISMDIFPACLLIVVQHCIHKLCLVLEHTHLADVLKDHARPCYTESCSCCCNCYTEVSKLQFLLHCSHEAGKLCFV